MKAIQITEVLLREYDLKRKMVIGGTGRPYTRYSIRDDFDIYCYMDLSGNCLFWGECIEGEDFFILKCDKVHKFQNIYKILNGKELNKK